MQPYGGVSRYFSEIITGIRALEGGVSAEVVGRYASNEFLPRIGVTGASSLLHAYQGRGRGVLLEIADHANNRILDRRLSRGGVDVCHLTYHHTLPRSTDVPLVLTIHDLIHELFPEVPARRGFAELRRAAAERADRIITGSESAAHDVRSMLGVPADKITVIHHGSTFTGEEPGNPDLRLPGRYVLYVGARVGYKNFLGMVEAIAPVMRDLPDVHLVAAGGGPFTAEETTFLTQAGIAGRAHQMPADDRSLATLYRSAQVFVLPSKYEGFGLPVLEAMAFGCACAVSNASSVPEVGGDAVAYFDPASPDEIAEAVRTLLEDTATRRALESAGRVRAATFTWERSARAHLAVYESCSRS